MEYGIRNTALNLFLMFGVQSRVGFAFGVCYGVLFASRFSFIALVVLYYKMKYNSTYREYSTLNMEFFFGIGVKQCSTKWSLILHMWIPCR